MSVSRPLRVGILLLITWIRCFFFLANEKLQWQVNWKPWRPFQVWSLAPEIESPSLPGPMWSVRQRSLPRPAPRSCWPARQRSKPRSSRAMAGGTAGHSGAAPSARCWERTLSYIHPQDTTLCQIWCPPSAG